MAFPEAARLEGPILQELLALGGEERVKFLYWRLVAYFPQLAEPDLNVMTRRRENRWKELVHRAGARLVKKGELHRAAGLWRLTAKGRQRAEAERMLLELPSSVTALTRPTRSHREIQDMLVEIGQALGRYAEKECQRYDVVWKESPLAPRLSHVFEVQVKGKVESALARLKHAYDTQRSKPVLIIADERDHQRARQWLRPYLSGSFHEIGQVTTVWGVEDIERLHRALESIKEMLQELL